MTAPTDTLFDGAAPEDMPYALRSADEQARRLILLTLPHISPLAAYLAVVRAAHPGKNIPSFDPCDSGIRAKALFLMEAPGPQAISSSLKAGGSGFVSRNNPDPAAKNLCLLMREANLARKDTLIWNIVPWQVGKLNGSKNYAVSDADKQAALPHLKPLLDLLPNLKMIVLMGRKTQLMEAEIRRLTDVPLDGTYHTSSQVMNVWPEKRVDVRDCLRQVAALLSDRDACGGLVR